MSTHEDDPPDPIDHAWRRAGDADAGRPPAAHRSAILARAAAVAAERRKPANEPWFRRRALAGVAGSLALAGFALLLWRETARDPPLPASVAPPARELADAPPAPVHLPEQSASATRGLRLEAPAQARALPAPAELAGTVEEAFPGLLQSDTPPRAIWILKDATGRTLRTGLLDPGETFRELAARLQQERPAEAIEPFEIGDVVTAAGARIQVGVARIR